MQASFPRPALYIPPHRRQPAFVGYQPKISTQSTLLPLVPIDTQKTKPPIAHSPGLATQGPSKTLQTASAASVASSPQPPTATSEHDPIGLYQGTLKAFELTQHRLNLWRAHTVYLYDIWKLSCFLFSKGTIEYDSLVQSEQDLLNAKIETQRQQTTLRGLQCELAYLLTCYPNLHEQAKTNPSPPQP